MKLYILKVGEFSAFRNGPLGRQRQVDFWVRGQHGLHSEFQDCQGHTEKPCLKNKKQKTKKKKEKKKKWSLELAVGYWVSKKEEEEKEEGEEEEEKGQAGL